MINTQELKDKLGTKTQEFETLITPYYTFLEPYQRGILLIALTLFLLFAVYSLTRTTKMGKLSGKSEALAEEKLMRQMAFFKRLKE